jgi:hypothetical protein
MIENIELVAQGLAMEPLNALRGELWLVRVKNPALCYILRRGDHLALTKP